MVPKHDPHSRFGKWLLKYRLKLILFSFLIIIPITFVIALYLGDYLRYKNVDFDGVSRSKFESSLITIEDQTNHQIINFETEDILFQVKLVDFLIPEYYDDTDGHYTFKARHEVNSNKQIHDLSVKFIIQTEWINAKSALTNIPVTTSFSTNRKISFNHILPQSPLWFVKVSAPYLYVEVTYHVELALDQEKTITHYFKTYLGDVTPTNITDKEAKDV